MTKVPHLDCLASFCRHTCRGADVIVTIDFLRKVEIDILNAIQYDLIPVGGAPNEETLEFMDAARFDYSLPPLSPRTFSDGDVVKFKDFTASIESRYEKEIMHYWQARNLIIVMEHCTQDLDKDFIIKNSEEIRDEHLKKTHTLFSEICQADMITSQILYEYCVLNRGSVTCVLTPDQVIHARSQEILPDAVSFF